MNDKNFFRVVRENLYGGSMTQAHVNGFKTVLSAINMFSKQEQAYILATVYHETARTLEPISEYGKGKSLAYGRWEKNSKGVEFCYTNGSKKSVYTKEQYPQFYYGRGYVQLTWYDNYLKAGQELVKGGFIENPNELLINPELANKPEYAAYIMGMGMLKGWFTGKKLSDYIANGKADYVGARRIINGTDCNRLIAGYAKTFELALS